MKYRLLDVLACSCCGANLALKGEIISPVKSIVDKNAVRNPHCSSFCGLYSVPIAERKNFDCFACFQKEIVEGTLCCTKCGKTYPVKESIPQLLSGNERDKGADQVRKKFEFQWQAWGHEKKIFGREHEENTQFILRGHSLLSPDYFKGKLVLDAGCGHGRFLKSFSCLGAEAIGIDFGSGIGIAKKFNESDGFVHTVMGDLTRLPLKKESFDYIFCSGVIHHTAHPQKTFSNLVSSLKKGGVIFIWVYPKQSVLWESSQKFLRSFLTRLPSRVLYYLCFIPVPLLSFVKTYSNTSLKTASWRQCAQVIYDWYSPKYQFHYTPDELKAWFGSEGMGDLEPFYIKTGLGGRKI
ncbi:MAG: methyltransferase domain-containing protein [Candidatus Omnitrophica bacterium]|nr:methyltransferase domain-containing protein [Candidatus Omnitrophota bacterium]